MRNPIFSGGIQLRIWTYGEANAKVRADLDLTNETFLTPDEMVGLWNDAIQRAAAQIQKLGVEDEYFTKQGTISLVTGAVRFPLPGDIYAQKIRGIIYQRGDEIYTVYRFRRRTKFVKIAEINQMAQDIFYQYDLENPDVATGYQLVLVPPSRETDPMGSPSLTIHYIREVLYVPLVSVGSQNATDATKIDIPEFMTYIFADVKYEVAKKIPHPNLEGFKADKNTELGLMIETLTEQVADDATEIEPDMSHYWRSS